MITELDFLFCIIWWIQILEKTFIKIKNKNICNIINGFTVTFDKLNASLLNKYIFFLSNSKRLHGCVSQFTENYEAVQLF